MQTRTKTILAALVAAVSLVVAAPETSEAAPRPSAEAARPGWRSVSAGAFHTCGIRTDGRLFCWGWDNEGQLGNGAVAADQGRPVEVAGRHRNWASVSAGTYHTCAVRVSGRLFCWGDDDAGQLGNGAATGNRLRPVEVAGGHRTWRSVSAGTFHTCAVRTSGRAFCWGNDAFGQLGNGGPLATETAPAMVASVTDWTALDTGGDHTCGRRQTGEVFCWGDDSVGQLGNGIFTGSSTPGAVGASGVRFTSVSAGTAHTCARADATLLRQVVCWGEDSDQQLGNGPGTEPKQTPVTIGPDEWASVSAGAAHSCARNATGMVACWGADADGQLGDGRPLATRSSWSPVAGSARFATLSVGSHHTCGITVKRALRCWGDNERGQLGTGLGTPDRPAPVLVPGPGSVP